MLLAALAALLATAAPAEAAKSCGRQVLDDWYDGRIDGTYEFHCYDDAIEIIPRDVRDYSSAEDDIRRALQAALRGKPAPPNQGGPGVEPKSPPPKPAKPETPTKTTKYGTPEVDTTASPEVDRESASALPIPLLILAGLALLLVAGGSAGYVVRRLQARRIPPPAL